MRILLLIITCSLVSVVSSASVCRQCQGRKYCNIKTACPVCDGKGVVGSLALNNLRTCTNCRGITTTRPHPRGKGSLVYASGQVVKRVPCPLCNAPKYTIITLSPRDLSALACGKSITNNSIVIEGDKK